MYLFSSTQLIVCRLFFALSLPSDDVEFEVSSDRRTGKPIAVKLLKIKPEVLPEERISGQVGPDLHAYPFTKLHGYIHPVKEYHFIFGSVLVCHPDISVNPPLCLCGDGEWAGLGSKCECELDSPQIQTTPPISLVSVHVWCRSVFTSICCQSTQEKIKVMLMASVRGSQRIIGSL